MLYAAIDTNVLVSALLNVDSKPGLVLLSVFHGETIPLLNREILAEYREVLARKKFRFPPDLVDIVLNRLAAVGMDISDVPAEYSEVIDPEDRCFYAVTMSRRENEDAWLVTGNTRHFPAKPFIVTPAQFIEILHAKREQQ